MKLRSFIFTLLVSITITSNAEVKLPKVFTNDMVLQRDIPIKIWGWADKRETIAITFLNETVEVKADRKGHWTAELKPAEAGGPYELVIKGENEITLSNILVGDVWICSGQSNMQWPLSTTNGAEAAIKNSTNPTIRLFTVERNTSTVPLDDCESEGWMICGPETVPSFSAVAYYFGKKLNEDLDVPIGLLHTSWGGTNVETWISADAISQVEGFEGIQKEVSEFDEEVVIKEIDNFVNMAKKCSKLEIIPKTMQRFKSLSLFEFKSSRLSKIPTMDLCAGNVVIAVPAQHNRGNAPAAGMFHKVKFDLLKAFYIVYFVSTNKKGITSTELSRKLNLRQKTCWGFKRKVMKAMESSENHPIEGDVEVDETVFGGQEENTKGRKNINKKLVVLAIEKKNKGVSRLYARVIPNASAEQLGGFMKAHIDPKAKITTDKWTGYIPLKADFENLTRVASGKKGSNFPELHRVVMNLKSWLRGVHHHVNDLQDYLNEYCYRFNRSFMKENIFDNLMKRMIEAEPCYIKNISQ
jgi:hypothetical protein